MGYVFERSESVGDAVRRVAYEELDTALADLSGERDELDTADAVHDCRKRCKKLRGLVRLVRPVLGRHYGAANADIRDAARELSGTRDAQALAVTFSKLVEHSGAGDDPRLATIAGALHDASTVASESVDQAAAHVAHSIELLTGVRRRVDRWPLDDLPRRHDGFSAFRPGLTATYRQGRRALRHCGEEMTAEAFHEWRKHAKYGWYHLRLVRTSSPSVLGPLADAFGSLADTLGDAHDLATLADQLRADPRAFGGAVNVAAALDLIERGRSELDDRALRVGGRLYAERPDAFADRIEAYWLAWHRVGPELVVGSVDVVLDDIRRHASPS